MPEVLWDAMGTTNLRIVTGAAGSMGSGFLLDRPPLPPLAVTRPEAWDGPVHILPARLSRVYMNLWTLLDPLHPLAPFGPLPATAY